MRYIRPVAAALIVASLAAPALSAQAPQSGWRGEFLGLFGGDEQKYYQLAEAMPWEKYSWRPGAGVRSVCEVYLHIAGANYLFAEQLGVKPPSGVNVQTIETCPAGRDRVLATMRASFAHFKGAVMAMPDGDADKAFELFGMKFTRRSFMMFVMGHTGEHLGQSIAYARSNGVVPPWSARPGGM